MLSDIDIKNSIKNNEIEISPLILEFLKIINIHILIQKLNKMI
jgi:hypothetical protein